VNSLFFRKKLDVNEASLLIANFVSMQDGPTVDGWIIDVSKELNINSDYIKNEVLYLKASVGYMFITERYGNTTYWSKPIGFKFIGTYIEIMKYMHSGKYMFDDFFKQRCVEYSATVHGDYGSGGTLFSKDGLDKMTKQFVKYLSDEGSAYGMVLGFTVPATLCKALLDIFSGVTIKV